MVLMVSRGTSARLLRRLVIRGRHGEHRIIHARCNLRCQRLIYHRVIVQRLRVQIRVILMRAVLSKDAAVLVWLLVSSRGAAPMHPVMTIEEWRLLAQASIDHTSDRCRRRRTQRA